MDRPRFLSSGQVSEWLGARYLHVPSGPVAGVYVPWTTNGYNGLINKIGTDIGIQLGIGTFVNPSSNAPVGSANRPAGTITAYQVLPSQSADLDSYRLAYRAFDHSITADGSVSNGGEIHTPSGANQWWKVDFGIKKIIPERVGIQARTDSQFLPGTFTIAGSNDNVEWATLYSVNNDAPGSGQWKSWPIVGTTAYRYIRLLQPASTYFTIGDVEFWGALVG